MEVNQKNHCSDPVIQLWLQKIFQDEEVPLFYENPEFMERLSSIMLKNEEAENDFIAMIKAEKNLKKTYNTETEELKSLTEMLHLRPEAYDKVEALASLAAELNLKEPTIATFILAISDLRNNEFKEKEDKLVHDFKCMELKRKIDDTRKMNEKLKKSLKKVGEEMESLPKLQNEVQTFSGFLTAKAEDYTKKLKVFEQTIQERAVDPELHHTALIKKNESVQLLQNEIKELESKLRSYKSLPPNEELTLLKIQESAALLEKLKEESHALYEWSVKGTDSPLAETFRDSIRIFAQNSASESPANSPLLDIQNGSSKNSVPDVTDAASTDVPNTGSEEMQNSLENLNSVSDVAQKLQFSEEVKNSSEE